MLTRLFLDARTDLQASGSVAQHSPEQRCEKGDELLSQRSCLALCEPQSLQIITAGNASGKYEGLIHISLNKRIFLGWMLVKLQLHV